MSPRRVSRRISTFTAFHQTLPWVRTTPLGVPVVPEANIRIAGASVS